MIPFTTVGTSYVMSRQKNNDIGQSIDRIYHSESWQDMQMKIDIEAIDIDLDAFIMLCSTLCYHYGYWPHTRPRFYAFMKLLALKRPNALSSIKMNKSTYDAVEQEINGLKNEQKEHPWHTPGYRSELRAWCSIAKLLKKIQDVNVAK